MRPEFIFSKSMNIQMPFVTSLDELTDCRRFCLKTKWRFWSVLISDSITGDDFDTTFK